MGLGHEISECTRTDKRIHPGSFGSPTRIDNNDSFVILLRSWYNRIRSKARTLHEIAKTISNEGTMNSFESRCALFDDFARSSTSVVHACLEMQIEMKQTEYREILNRKWKSSGDTCFFPIFFQSFHLLFGSRHSDVNKIWTTNERICCAIFLFDTCIYTSLYGIFHQFHLPRFFFDGEITIFNKDHR